MRAGNVIGGGDWSLDRIVPDAIYALTQNKQINIRNPNATRPWQHVLDPLSGYLHLGAKLYLEPKKYSGAWNFGPSNKSIQTVHDLVAKIINFWGEGSAAFAEETNHLHETTKLNLNCDKAQEFLGWYPRWNFERSVLQTVSWYKKITQGISALQMSSQQINDYMESSV